MPAVAETSSRTVNVFFMVAHPPVSNRHEYRPAASFLGKAVEQTGAFVDTRFSWLHPFGWFCANIGVAASNRLRSRRPRAALCASDRSPEGVRRGRILIRAVLPRRQRNTGHAALIAALGTRLVRD